MRRQIVQGFKQVFGFLRQGIDFEANGRRRFEQELKDLIAPHMPVLVHRRAKLLDGSGHDRWAVELDGFMQRSLWPLLGADRAYAERNRTFVTLMLDVAIAQEQRRTADVKMAEMPLVSRFDAGWAT